MSMPIIGLLIGAVLGPLLFIFRTPGGPTAYFQLQYPWQGIFTQAVIHGLIYGAVFWATSLVF